MIPVIAEDGYVELHCCSNYSFLHGASHPDELVLRAASLGQRALGLTDRNSLAGVVRAHVAARQIAGAGGFRLLVGVQLDLCAALPNPPDNPWTIAESLLVYPIDRSAYGALSELITLGRRRAPKGQCYLTRSDLEAAAPAGLLMIQLPPETLLAGDQAQQQQRQQEFALSLTDFARRFPGQVYLAAQDHLDGLGQRRLACLAALAERAGVALIACNAVHYHLPSRRALQDVLVCVREGLTIDEAGFALFANGERYLKSAAEMRWLFRNHPQAVAETRRFAERIRFSLDDLRYAYPRETTHNGFEPQEELERLTWQGARQRFGPRLPPAVRATIERELALVAQLDYAPYFLTVEDLVRFARNEGILCQGRGSAANSVICYCLGITAVDPTKVDLLFERFLSAARNEPPDIDVDFEHERREEVIQYIYRKYGRHRAGLAATVVTYRTRGALRDVGKVMGLSADSIEALARNLSSWNSEGFSRERIVELGYDPDEPQLAMTLALSEELLGFPRHLSQHVGGFVLTDRPLSQIVPIENAAMADRTVVQWDKDDLEALHILKVDVLALGMLTCIRKAFDLLRATSGKQLALHSVPSEDPAVYEMISRADTLGVFQIESRAQMSMLPRLQPRTFYDLVIEVAIVRPGPIQGDMVHPYLRRRQGKERVDYPSPALERVLGKTLGVPLFQEQAMKIAIVAAGFTPEEADQLRRAMATFRKNGLIHHFGDKLHRGMAANGYAPEFAEKLFNQIKGFGTYGFPESHAASFALLVYVSCWLKCHHPDLFACALLNSQPMGFYAPGQIICDAQNHGIDVRPVDINHSHWDNSLELPTMPRHAAVSDPVLPPRQAIRLGLRQVKGMSEAAARALIALRGNGYQDLAGLWRRVQASAAARCVTLGHLEALARADAFASLALSRRQAFWDIRALPPEPLPLFAATGELDADILPEPPSPLPVARLGEEVADDYRALRLSLKAHPMALLRRRCAGARIGRCRLVSQVSDGTRVTLAGLVLVRQRPGSASGVIFITLEDETGIANLVVWPKLFSRCRRAVLGGSLLRVKGRVQKEGLPPYQVTHLIAEDIEDLSDWLADLEPDEAENHPPAALRPEDLPLALADELRRPASQPLSDPEAVARLRADQVATTSITRDDWKRRRKAIRPGSRDFH